MGEDDMFLTNFALLSRPVTGRPTKNAKQDEHDGVTLKVHIMNFCIDDKKLEQGYMSSSIRDHTSYLSFLFTQPQFKEKKFYT